MGPVGNLCMACGQAPLVHGLCAGFPWGLVFTTKRPVAPLLPAGSSTQPAVQLSEGLAARRTLIYKKRGTSLEPFLQSGA